VRSARHDMILLHTLLFTCCTHAYRFFKHWFTAPAPGANGLHRNAALRAVLCRAATRRARKRTRTARRLRRFWITREQHYRCAHFCLPRIHADYAADARLLRDARMYLLDNAAPYFAPRIAAWFPPTAAHTYAAFLPGYASLP